MAAAGTSLGVVAHVAPDVALGLCTLLPVPLVLSVRAHRHTRVEARRQEDTMLSLDAVAWMAETWVEDTGLRVPDEVRVAPIEPVTTVLYG